MIRSLLQKQLAILLALCLAFPAGQTFAQNTPQAGAGAPAQNTASGSSPAAPQTGQAQGNAGGAQNSSGQQPTNLTRPVGTAVAPYEKSSGVTASRPAGAVIAPAKQRRVRSIFIKIAVVIGAGAAIATVAVLSHASPSQPH